MSVHWGKVLLAAVVCVGATTACEWDYDIWIPRSADADPLYRFVEHHKAGYIDLHGAVVIPPSLESYGNYGGEFHSGLLKLDSGQYVDQSGNKLKVDVKSSWSFSEGLAAALAPNGMWGTSIPQASSPYRRSLATLRADTRLRFLTGWRKSRSAGSTDISITQAHS